MGVKKACDALGVPRASYYRSQQTNTPDRQNKPCNHPRGLTLDEQKQVQQTLNSERFMDQAPREIYATLLDEGQYICSVRTMYRILQKNQAAKERRDQLRHPNYQKPELLARGPKQVWSWDITKLLGPKTWEHYHLYVILDIYSRYVVGWTLAPNEASEIASQLIRQSIEKQRVPQEQLTLHSDRGPSMSSTTVAQLLGKLGVTKSHSRPHVSNDNPYSESQFKTMKYSPQFPKRFGSFEDALSFCRRFFPWYNEEHHHSGIQLLTPSSLHYGQAQAILHARWETLKRAYLAQPERFVHGEPKLAELPAAVWINPPKEKPTKEKEKPLELHCPQRPDASLTHPRSEYPLEGCSSAEPAAVGPIQYEPARPQQQACL